MTSKALLGYSLPLILSTGLFCVIDSASAKVIFKADFETGDLSEWSTTGTRGQNATPRNIQVVTDIVQEGKYAGKFTIHEDDVFNAQQLRVQVGGPKVTVEEGSDTYMSFYLYMAEAPKDRDNFFYWEGHAAAALRQRHDLVGRAEGRRRGAHQVRHRQPRAQRHGMGGGFHDRQMAPAGDAHPLVGGQREREHAALVRRRSGAGQEAEDQRRRVRLLLPARNPSQSAPSLGGHDLLRQFHPRRHAGRGREGSPQSREMSPSGYGAVAAARGFLSRRKSTAAAICAATPKATSAPRETP